MFCINRGYNFGWENVEVLAYMAKDVSLYKKLSNFHVVCKI